MKVRQHIPAFVTGPTPQEAECRTLEELRALPWVRRWEEEPRFVRWSVADNRYLMATVGERFWVVAYLENAELYGLPVWTYPRS